MNRFVSEIQDASDRLGIATDRVQEFRMAAKHAGYELNIFDKVFNNLAKSRLNAVNGGKEMESFKTFGLDENQVSHLNKTDALKAIMQKTKSMTDSKARENLGGIFDAKTANALMAMRDDILNPTKNIVSSSQLEQVNALNDAFEDLRDTTIAGLIPAFTALIDYINKTILGFKQDTRTGDEMYSQAAALYWNKYGKEPKSKGILAGMNYQSEIIGANLFDSEEEKQRTVAAAGKKYITSVFGSDIYEELMKEFVPPPSIDSQLNELKAKRVKDRQARDAMLKEGEDFHPSKRPPEKVKRQVDIPTAGELSSNQFLKIGGAIGIDAQYRLERLQAKSISLLERIASNTDNLSKSGTNDSEYSYV